MKKLKLHPAAQSMTALGLSLILLIGIGEVLGRLVFPAGSESDRYAALIARHGSLLEQVAEDVTDDTQWPGIMGLPEVQEALKEGGITGFETRDDGVAFRLEATEIGERWILYLSGGSYDPSVQGIPEHWIREENDKGTVRWRDVREGKDYVNVRRLGEVFFLEERFFPE